MNEWWVLSSRSKKQSRAQPFKVLNGNRNTSRYSVICDGGRDPDCRDLLSFLKRRNQIANSLSADGVITSFATEMGRSGYVHYPVVEFKIPSGQSISFKSSVGSSRTGSVGQQVKVLYDARNPMEAEIDALTSLWLVPGCMVAVGLAFTIGGLFLAVLMSLVLINQR